MKSSSRIFIKHIYALIPALIALLVYVPYSLALPPSDLTVTDIAYDRRSADKCTAYVIIKNRGEGTIPYDQLMRVSVRISTPSQTITLPLRNSIGTANLENPGGTATLFIPHGIGDIPAGTSKTFTVLVDPDHVTMDGRILNNKLTETLRCPLFPDLAVTKIYKKATKRGCEVWAELKNVSKVSLPQDVFQRSKLKLSVGQYKTENSLSFFDRSGKLMKPGGTVQVMMSPVLLSPLAVATARAEIIIAKIYGNPIMDANLKNNIKTLTIYCPGNRINEQAKPNKTGLPKIPTSPNSNPISPPPIPRKNPLSR